MVQWLSDPTGYNQWRMVVKRADTSRVNNTLTDDPDLQFAMLASTKYAFECMVYYETTLTPKMQFQNLGPASPTLVRMITYTHQDPGTGLVITHEQAYSTGGLTLSGTGGSGTIHVMGIIQNGINAGNYRF